MDYIAICNYINKYESKFDECLREAKENNRKAYDDLDDKCIEEAIEHFEEVANTEEVVGYYLSHYKEDAYTIWSDNTKNIQMTAQDESVEKILSSLV